MDRVEQGGPIGEPTEAAGGDLTAVPSGCRTRRAKQRESRKIGLREVKALKTGEIIWDGGTGSVVGFCARRQRSQAIAYCLA